MLEKNIKKLIRILEESSLDEMEISSFWGKDRIRIRKKTSNISAHEIQVPIIDKDISKDELSKVEKIKNIDHDFKKSDQEKIINDDSDYNKTKSSISIKAPLVGTFYSSPKPGEPPFVSVGDKIKEGQVICIIEAMKIFNEIESEVSGTVLEIVAKDSSPVEYDQSLIIVSSD